MGNSNHFRLFYSTDPGDLKSPKSTSQGTAYISVFCEWCQTLVGISHYHERLLPHNWCALIFRAGQIDTDKLEHHCASQDCRHTEWVHYKLSWPTRSRGTLEKIPKCFSLLYSSLIKERIFFIRSFALRYISLRISRQVVSVDDARILEM